MLIQLVLNCFLHLRLFYFEDATILSCKTISIWSVQIHPWRTVFYCLIFNQHNGIDKYIQNKLLKISGLAYSEEFSYWLLHQYCFRAISINAQDTLLLITRRSFLIIITIRTNKCLYVIKIWNQWRSVCHIISQTL